MFKKVILAIIIVAQLVVITIIGLQIYKSSKVLGEVTYNPIPEDNILRDELSALNYFYEPYPGEQTNVNKWVPYSKFGVNTINKDTLNERYEYDLNKDEKSYRIITLGDSNTYGLYVDTEDNWTELLEDTLNTSYECTFIDTFQVINLGVQGYDLEYSLERYKKRGKKYKPDLIIWLINSDDMYQVNELIFKKEKEIKANMISSGKWSQEVSDGNYYPSWSKAMAEVFEEYQNEIPDMLRSTMRRYIKISDNKTLVISYMPDVTKIQEMFSDIFYPNNISIMGISDIRTIEGLYFENDYHPTVEGHKVIAQDVYDYLISSNLIECY